MTDPGASRVTEGLVRDLAARLGPEHVLVDPDLTATYASDWTGRWTSRPVAVVRPGTTDQVAAVVRACADAGVSLVPQGGNTGLVGGSVPHQPHLSVIVSTRRLTALEPVDLATRQVVVGAGVTLARLQTHARGAGLRYGVDLAARDSATVGGTVATNAGGLRVVAFGDTRRQVVGLEAVMADSTVVSRLAGLAKDNSGYDLSQLLVGSEGTLGIVTAARLRLLPAPARPPQVALVGLGSPDEALRWLSTPGLVAAELMLEAGLSLVERVTGLAHPLDDRHPIYLLIEVEGDLPHSLVDHDVAVGESLWAYRERHTEAIATRGVVHKLDVAVPVDAVPELVRSVEQAMDQGSDGVPFYLFGHLGDGNLHLSVVASPAHGRGSASGPDLLRQIPVQEAVEELVYALVAGLGGTVAAEHGVGVAKTQWLSLSRTPSELAAQRALKHALDPAGLFNPSVLVPST